MALLLNRKYGSRFECLYYILKSCYAKFGTSKEFALKDLKYDKEDKYNVHQYCKLLLPIFRRKCCPFLVNSLNSSKCYATQSVDSDSTKSKAVSDIGGSLEALGFINRAGKNIYKISENGEKWVLSDFESTEWEELAREGVLSYGVAVGFLSKIEELPDVFSIQGIYLSYPNTTETVDYIDAKGKEITISLSTNSQRDSNTRTLSRIIAWCVAVGFIEPIGVKGADSKLAHIKYREFLNRGELTVRKFKKTELCKHIFDNKFLVKNPLSYSRLHKNVGSLRENGGEDLRKVTMEYNSNILNRRYLIVFVLNFYSQKNKSLDLGLLVDKMKNYKDNFFSSGKDAYTIMQSESEIADIAGIPFVENIDGSLQAKTTIDLDKLNEDAPKSVINLAKKIIEEMEKKK